MRDVRSHLIVFSGVFLLLLGACGEPKSLTRVIEGAVDDGIPGISVHVRMGDLTWDSAFGYSNIINQTPMRNDDRLLAIGSTEPLIAAIILQLVDEGLLSLNDGLTTIIGLDPLYRVSGVQRMTVRHALMQTTGFHNHYELLGFLNGTIGQGVDPSLIHDVSAPLSNFQLRGYRPLTDPGDKAAFSAANATILGMVIEKIEGIPLNSSLNSRILVPSGVESGISSFGGPDPTVNNYMDLTNTYVEVSEALVLVDENKSLFDLSAINPSWAWAAGGVCLNAKELAQIFDSLFIGKILKPNLLDLMVNSSVSNINPDDENGPSYGLGLMHRELSIYTPGTGEGQTFLTYGFDGQAMGYSSLVYHIPELDWTISLLANGSGDKINLFGLFEEIVSILAVNQDEIVFDN